MLSFDSEIQIRSPGLIVSLLQVLGSKKNLRQVAQAYLAIRFAPHLYPEQPRFPLTIGGILASFRRPVIGAPGNFDRLASDIVQSNGSFDFGSNFESLSPELCKLQAILAGLPTFGTVSPSL